MTHAAPRWEMHANPEVLDLGGTGLSKGQPGWATSKSSLSPSPFPSPLHSFTNSTTSTRQVLGCPCWALSRLHAFALAAPLAWNALPFSLDLAHRGPVTYRLLYAFHIHFNFPTTFWFNEHSLCTDRVPGFGHKTLSFRVASHLIRVRHAHAAPRIEKMPKGHQQKLIETSQSTKCLVMGWRAVAGILFYLLSLCVPNAKVNALHFLKEGAKPQRAFLLIIFLFLI